MNEHVLRNIFEDYRDRVKAAAREIRDRQVTVQVGNGAVTATALATGQLTGLRISPSAMREYDHETLSGLVLSAVQQVLAQAANTKLESLRPLMGAATSFQELLTRAGESIGQELRDEVNAPASLTYGDSIGYGQSDPYSRRDPYGARNDSSIYGGYRGSDDDGIFGGGVQRRY